MALKSVHNAEMLAKKRHAKYPQKDGMNCHPKHLEDVVNRLKGLGVIKPDLLCAGWLHDIMERTDVTFDELYEKFGSPVSVLVSSLTMDMSLPRKRREREYVLQLKDSSPGAKLIMLCDISASLGDLKDEHLSKSKRTRNARQNRRYLDAIKHGLPVSEYPNAALLVDGINRILQQHGQRAVRLQDMKV